MDESLEFPDAPTVKVAEDIAPEEDEQSSDEEDGGLDWTKLLPAAARPVIPKRGEKEYEPRAGGGSNLQLHVLDRSRSAMFETLRATRTTSSKAISYAIWHPSLARAEVTVMRGIHFSSMGHSAPRPIIGEDGIEKIQKRLELLPEETIYLIERGSMFCWKETDYDVVGQAGLEGVQGSPMTVQQAYAEMIGREDLTLEKLQVFTYLKRLGYVVTRANPPNSHYPVPSPLTQELVTTTLTRWFKSTLRLCASVVSSVFRRFNWWHPLRLSCFWNHDKNYGFLFRSLRFMPAGHSVPLRPAEHITDPSPYTIFYNVYKPATPFKKSSPGPPDFQMVIVNGRTTPMPSLHELTNLFDVLPELPTPLPRQRRPIQGIGQNDSKPPSQPAVRASSSNEPISFIKRRFPWAFPRPPSGPLERRPNPFMALKAGKKMIVVAVVDAGSTSFFRFSQGAFNEWPMA